MDSVMRCHLFKNDTCNAQRSVDPILDYGIWLLFMVPNVVGWAETDIRGVTRLFGGGFCREYHVNSF